MRWDDAPEDLRWFAGGAFDGDGCVNLSAKRNILPRLEMTQALRGRALLDTFHNLFGGAIYERAKPRDPERHQAICTWVLTGALAAIASFKLAPYTFLKRPQLHLVSTFQKPLTMTAKRALYTRVSSLKKQPHEAIANVPLPVPYTAGLLDTDGYFRGYPSVGLQLTQKYPAVLLAMQETYGGGVCGDKWYVNGTKAKRVVEIVKQFIVAKRPQADIVLNAKLTNDIDAKIALMPFQGNQGRRHRSPGVSKLNCCMRLTRSE